jgi:hypothetical protein
MQTLFSSEDASTPLGNYTICYGQLLGKGTTGTVYKGKRLSTQASRPQPACPLPLR